MPIREMLLETFVHMPPLNVLEGLTPAEATAKPAKNVHSIAEVLAHLQFWQSWWLRRIEGHAEPMVGAAHHGWPPVSAADWPRLVAEFGADLKRAVALGEDAAKLDMRITPAIEFPPLANHTVREALIHVAQHNAHHLGQIVILRQLIGRWPPPQGSWTW